MRQQVIGVFDLPGTAEVRFGLVGEGSGGLQLATLRLDDSTPGVETPLSEAPFAITYFQTVPLTATAVADEGSVFDGWVEFPEEASPTLTLLPEEGLTLTARFVPAQAPVLVHYWSFNQSGDLLTPTYTAGGAALEVLPGVETIEDGTGQDFAGTNNRLGEPTGSHLRVNNPLAATLTFSLPTKGFTAPVLRYESRRSGQGAGLQTLHYTLDGSGWIQWPTDAVLENAPPLLYTYDFTEVEGVANNSNFAVRITFARGEGGTGGNNRFDNVSLDALPLPGANLPPLPAELPTMVEAVSGSDTEIAMDAWFTDPEGDSLAYTVTIDEETIATASVSGSTLTLTGLTAGETALEVTVDDGTNDPVTAGLRILVYPSPHPVAQGPYVFAEWSPQQPRGAFPPHMLFLQSDRNDPDANDPLLFAYDIPADDAADPADTDLPYAATGRTRLNGLDTRGLAFINTGRGRDLGGALLALDTRGVSGPVTLHWLAGTELPNTRIYALRLQYRTSLDADFTDLLDAEGAPFVYTRSSQEGHTSGFGPVALPATLLGQSNLQLLWRYHHVSGTSGARARLRLDDLVVQTHDHPIIRYPQWVTRVFPDPADRADPGMSGPEALSGGDGWTNFARYALADALTGLTGLLPRLDPQGQPPVLRFPFAPEKEDVRWIVEVSGDLHSWSVLFDSNSDPLPAMENGEALLPVTLPDATDGPVHYRVRVLKR